MSRLTSFFFFVLNAILVAPIAVSAQGLKNASGNLGTTAKKAGADDAGDLEGFVGTGIRAVLTLVGLIFLVLMVYAGFLWMTARGEETQIEKAKNIVSAAMIGLFVVMGAYAITYLVLSRFGG